MFIGVATGALCFVVGYLVLSNVVSDFNEVVKHENKLLLKSSQESVNLFREKTYNKLKLGFQSSSELKMIRDSKILAPLISNFAINDIKNFFEGIYQNDKKLEEISLAVLYKGEWQLWQYFSKEFPSGVDIGGGISKDGKNWEFTHLSKSEKVMVRQDILNSKKTPNELFFREINTDKPDGKIIISISKVHNEDLIWVVTYVFSIKELYAEKQKQADFINSFEENLLMSSQRTQEKIQTFKKKLTFDIFVYISIVSMFIFGFVVLFSKRMGQKLLSPLYEMISKLESAGKGNYEKMDTSGIENEVLKITEKFNFMVDEIQRRDSELKAYSDNLESLVELKTSELEKERQKNIQESKLRSIGEMAAGVAHEINNPLTVIIPNVKRIRKYLLSENNINEKVRKSLLTIEKMAKRIEVIVKSVKAFSRNQEEIECEPCNTKDILDFCIDLKLQKLKSSSIEFTIIDESKDACIFVKKVEISQILVNLIGNAEYEILKDQTSTNRFIKVYSYTKDEHLFLEVSNSGPKIDEKIVDQIMEPFYTTKPIGEGAGLGLSISRSIANSFNGDLFVDLTKEFTTFTVKIPLSKIKYNEAI